MLTAFVLALLLSPVAASGAAPRAALAPLPGVGLSKSDVKKTLQKASAELAAAGYEVIVVDDVAPECAGEAACLDRVRVGAGAALLVTLELLRVGPVVQVASSLQGPGAWVQGQRTSGVTPWSEPRVLPDDVYAQAAARVPAAAAVAAPSEPAAESSSSSSDSSDSSDSSGLSDSSAVPTTAAPAHGQPSADAEPPAPSALSPAQAAGVGVGGLGAAVVVVGLVVSAAQYATMNDPRSLGSAKEDAVVPFWVGVGVAGTGVAALVAGVAVAVVAPAP
jgi:hypothetical protein